jgi:hypothetical protein
MISEERFAARIRELEIPGYGDDEVGFLLYCVGRANPTHVFEWGTNRGSSARIFYEAGVARGIPLVVHSTELRLEEAFRDRDHPGEAVGLFVRDLPVVLHEGDGLLTTLDLVDELRPERPLFFLDGYHSYDQVRLELRSLAPFAAPIVLHDSVHLTGVRDAIETFARVDELGKFYEREDLASQAGMTALWPT